MISTIASVFLLIVGILRTPTTNAADLPGNYTVPKHSPSVCFAARFDLVLNVEYYKTDGKTNIAKIPLNNETFKSYNGFCAFPKSHVLTILMLDGLTSITFEFSLDEKNQTALKKVNGVVTINNSTNYFPDYSEKYGSIFVFSANESLFATDRSNSYRCNSKTKIDNLKTDGNATVKSIDLENLRVQPFVDSTVVFNDFGVEKLCAMDIIKSPNFIPIIVGVCLGVLVIVVLVVYLIVRRRNRNGYQSV